MPKEAVIRDKVKKALEKDHWITWCPANVKYQETDIWGIFDLVAWHWTNNIKFVQFTTSSNISARRKKIENFLEKNELNTDFEEVEFEVWGWNKKKKEFKIIKL